MSRAGRYRFGLWAELACRVDLRLRGYRICGVRARTPMGEIDIVARRGDVVAVIEVKARRDAVAAALALQGRQRARIVQAARWLMGRRPEWVGAVVRFDVMLVTPWRRPRHLVNAWGDEA